MTKRDRDNLAFDIATATLVIRSELERLCPDQWRTAKLIEVERRLSEINEMARDLAR